MYCHTFIVRNNSRNCSGEALRRSPIFRPGTAVKGKEVGGRSSESIVEVFVEYYHVCTNNSVRYSRVKLLFVSHVSHIETTCMQVQCTCCSTCHFNISIYLIHVLELCL
jgi:hypothetical protein